MSRDRRRPKVLLLSHNGGLAGAQRTLLSLLQTLPGRGFDCRLVVPQLSDLSALAEQAGVPVDQRALVHWAPCLADIGDADRFACLWRCARSLRARAWALAAVITRHDIDLVYTNTVTPVEAALAARMTGRPHIWHVHEPIRGNAELLPILPEWLYSFAIDKLSVRVIVPSRALAARYPRLRKKMSVVHNGIDVPAAFDRADARARVAAALGLDAGKTWIVTVGAIQPRKDHRTFLAAAARVRERLPAVHFVIVGHGADEFVGDLDADISRLGLAAYVTRVPRWAGPITDFLAAADVAVISSLQESFGLTAAEALAVETPVVSTRCGGPEEIIAHGENGLLVAMRDAAGLAEAIGALAMDPGLRQRFGSSGRLKIMQSFTEAAYVSGIADVIASALPTSIGVPDGLASVAARPGHPRA